MLPLVLDSVDTSTKHAERMSWEVVRAFKDKGGESEALIFTRVDRERASGPVFRCVG